MKDMKSLDSSSHSSPQWPFPSCDANLNTLSFTTTNNYYSKHDMISATVSSSTSFSAMSDDPIESVIRGLRSERLFFEPESSCSLLVSSKQADRPGSEVGVVYKESEALSMDSSNPCEDFRRSMEEMVEAHGLKDWQGLEELLGCYLKINHKLNHAYIMAAFIDLLLNLSITSSSKSSSSSSTTTCLSSTNLNSSPSSPLSLPSSSLTTPCLSSLLDHDDHDDDDDDGKDDDDRVNVNYLV
ncbi:transcription repressor OFP15-like [Silene latifolia]|uniref:transcription repressor OFP15-like n=1 Tax=Silene latifolia TaxID=37657 RepID=UPI003D788E6B